jgi:hypothetical protein
MADFSCASTKQTSHWRFRILAAARWPRADQRTPGRRHQRRLPMSTLSAPRRRASALKRNCDVARCAVPRHLKLRAMVGRGGIHGSS